jgi:CheY-like chemotaxis protein
MLGVPIILTDVDNMNTTLEFIKEAPKAGVVIFGLPYQLIELHRKLADKRNVVTVLKPVKPSDFQRALAKLSALSQSGEMDWMHDSISEERETIEKLQVAMENSVDNSTIPIKGQAAETPEDGGELKGMNVLLVEDNAMNQQMAKFSIIKCGADLQIAVHGQEAVDLIRDRFEKKLPNYDCILMDMMMPVMDGATATVEIRKMEKKFGIAKPHTIVGLSANVGPEYTEQVKKAGMDGSMSKPFYPATLRATLNSVCKVGAVARVECS